MHLFSRMVTLRGNPRDYRPYLDDICDKVNDVSSFDVSLWQGLLGMPAGTFVFSTIVDSRAALYGEMATITADAEYLEMADRGLEFYVGPAEDRLVTIVHNAGGELRRAGVGAAASITTAQAAHGKIREALGWSVGMADLVASITGVPTHLGSVAHSAFAEVQWTATVADLSEVDRTEEAIAKDEDYLARVEDAGDLFVPGTGRQMLAVRIR